MHCSLLITTVRLSDTNQCIPAGIDMIAPFMAVRSIMPVYTFYIDLLGNVCTSGN